jgi:hypothetical protein
MTTDKFVQVLHDNPPAAYVLAALVVVSLLALMTSGWRD